MPASLLEIVELSDGEIVLRRASGDKAPLVNIRFSPETLDYLPEARMEVAKAMIEAGIATAAELYGGEAELDFVSADDADDDSRILH